MDQAKTTAIALVCFALLSAAPVPAAAVLVSGHVTDANGTPIANVQITFLVAASGATAASALAGLDGAYQVTVSPGTYDVSLVPPSDSIFAPQTLSGRTLTGDTILDLVLVATSPVTTAVYTGALVDRSGAPIAGGPMTASLCLAGGGCVVSTAVAGDGTFSLTAPRGNYRLRLSASSASHPLPPGLTIDRPLSLFQDKMETIALENRTISGSVTGPLGAVGNATVLVSGSVSFGNFSGSWNNGAVTNGAGAFQVAALSGGATVTVFPPPASGAGAAAQLVDVSNDASTSITLPPQVTYSGTIVDRTGTAPALVTSYTLWLCGQVSCFPTSPNAQGAFSFGVGAGSYSLNLQGPLAPNPVTFSLQRSLTLSQNLVETISLPDRVLSGVMRSAGNPLGGLAVTVSLNGIDFDGFTGSLNGSIQTDPSGNYTLPVLPVTNGTLTLAPDAGRGVGLTSIDLSISGDTVLDIDLVSSVVLAVQLLDRTGTPLPVGQSVILCPQSLGNCTSQFSDTLGRAIFDVGPGNYWVSIQGSAPGSPDLPATFNYQHSLSVTQAMTETITVPNRRLSGTVVDPDGIPVPNVLLSSGLSGSATDNWNSSNQVLTDANGEFSMGVLTGAGSLLGTPPAPSGLAPFTVAGVTVGQDLVLGVFLQFITEQVSATVPAGGTVTTDTEGDGATPADPIETSVTTPTGGTVDISEAPVALSPPGHYQFLTQEIDITAPGASPANPLVLSFQMDASRIPAGKDQNTLQILRNGRPVPDCSLPPPTAFPDPCVSARLLLPDGDVVLSVRTSNASAWHIGISDQPCGSDADCTDAFACTEDVCVNGFCASLPHDDPCDNGLPCDGVERCYPSSGCGPGAAVVCPNDGDPCTVDSCDPATGACGMPIICPDDGNPCTQDVCEPNYGYCGIALDAITCDDLDSCTVGEACQYGYCYAPLASFTDAQCEVDRFLSEPPCPGLNATLQEKIDRKIAAVHARLERSVGSSDTRRNNRTIAAATRKLFRMLRPVNRWYSRQLISDQCYQALNERVTRTANLFYSLYR